MKVLKLVKITVASAKEFREAIKIAVDDMVSLISKSLSLEFQDAIGF
ncbi:MAG: hypothetical protein MR639_04270 [Clostridium sp.]|nr:hypothetical protein [Clostridium sp.]MDY5097560.1 hypothetical protein [Clostridium sp.]